MMTSASLTNAGLLLIVLGFILAFVAVLLMAVKSRGTGGQTRGGGILLIGPFPIIFGSDRESVRTLMMLAIVLIAIVLVFMVIPSLLVNR